MNEMRNAFNSYFKKLIDYYMQFYKTNPKVYYTESLNKKLMLSKPDQNEEIDWLPILQETLPNWEYIEKNLGFEICNELKSYYSIYLFFSLNGEFEVVDLYFDPISSQELLSEVILRQYSNGQCEFPNSQILMLGSAIINHDDRYSIFYDNETLEIFCFESDTGKRISLGYSLAKILSKMEIFE